LVDPEVSKELKALGVEFNNAIARSVDVPVIVKTYFKPADEVYPLLLDLDADGIGFDLTTWNYDELKSVIADYGYPFEIIDLGVSDALNVKLEPIEETATKALSVIDEAQPREVHVSANYRYDVLPYSYIRKKMRRLAEITFKLREMVDEG
jgi:methionine synthase II (cobalamin-independent)